MFLLHAAACSSTDEDPAATGEAGVAGAEAGATGGVSSSAGRATAGGSAGKAPAAGAESSAAGRQGQAGAAAGSQGQAGAAPQGGGGGAETAGAAASGGGSGSATHQGGAGGEIGEEIGGASAMDPVMTQSFVFTASTDGNVRAHSLDSETGALQTVAEHRITADFGDFFLATPADARTLFVSYNRGVTALSFDPAEPSLGELGSGVTGGVGTHIFASADGAQVFVAHYNEGALTHLGFDGSTFTQRATLQAGQNAHSSHLDPSESWLYVPCKGSDHVAQYIFDRTALDAGSVVNNALPGGPRHMTFHPTLGVAYVLGELDGRVHVRSMDPATGSLADELDSELLGAEGEKWGSDVQITPDGLHLYAVERNQRALYHFEVASDGTLSAAGGAVELGEVVRAFGMAPDGSQLLVGDAGGNLRVYALGSDGTPVRTTEALSGLGDVQATLVRSY